MYLAIPSFKLFVPPLIQNLPPGPPDDNSSCCVHPNNNSDDNNNNIQVSSALGFDAEAHLTVSLAQTFLIAADPQDFSVSADTNCYQVVIMEYEVEERCSIME